ncbi:MAG: hypothetical protein H7Z75_07125 [Ferruginibacter sp.]|nr:hypothetical protein [Cytophagales bacterium]
METEGWERTFRTKLNQLDTSPPQTGWNRARGWEKLETKLNNPSKSGRRRIIGWYYAAAVVSLLLISSFVITDQLHRQRGEIVRLQRELTRVQALRKYSVSHRDLPGQMAAEPARQPARQTQRVEPVGGQKDAKSNRPGFAHRKVGPVARPPWLTTPVAIPPARRLPTAEIVSAPTGSPERAAAMAPAVVTVPVASVTVRRKGTARSVTFVFPGRNEVNQNVRLAEQSTKPDRKVIFLSGESEVNASAQPETNQPFFFTAKPKHPTH